MGTAQLNTALGRRMLGLTGSTLLSSPLAGLPFLCRAATRISRLGRPLAALSLLNRTLTPLSLLNRALTTLSLLNRTLTTLSLLDRTLAGLSRLDRPLLRHLLLHRLPRLGMFLYFLTGRRRCLGLCSALPGFSFRVLLCFIHIFPPG